MNLVVVLFHLMLLYILYVYAGYPLILAILSSLQRTPETKEEDEEATRPPSVSILIPVFNEEEVIEEKILNALNSDYPEGLLDVVVSSDGSFDKTNEIVRRMEGPRVRLIENPVRAGKVSAIRAGFEKTTGDILILTDANVFFERGTVSRLVSNFRDPRIGAVSSDVRLIGDTSYSEAQSLYYKYERFIQKKESQLSSIIGVDGGLYAVRREVFIPPPPDMILDDFIISMEIAKRGKRVIYDELAVSFEKTPPRSIQEFKRKVRVETGNFQSLFHGWGIPSIRSPLLLFQYLSHKLLRWFTFIPLLLLLVIPPFILHKGFFYVIFLIGEILFYLTAVVVALWTRMMGEKRMAPLLSFPYYWSMENLAALVGFIRAVAGKAGGIWEKER